MAALIAAEGLTRHFTVAGDWTATITGKRPIVRAVDGVDFSVERGEAVGLLGESGCGKTTTGRLMLRLIEPTAGRVVFDGQDIAGLDAAGVRAFRRRAQLVFQNPYEAFNPRFTMRRALAEPLTNAGVPSAEHAGRMRAAMERVRLPDVELYYDKYPHQLSGGQLQRLVLARALVLEPEFIVADEPVSMLDVSVRAGILNVMRDVRERMGLAAVYISHDLALVRYVCRRTIVMYLGKVVEDGPTEEVVRSPQHPYSKALVQAVPVPHVEQSHEPLPIKGGLADARNPPSGCRFRTRCPHAFARCAEAEPPLVEVAPGHRSACHLHATAG